MGKPRRTGRRHPILLAFLSLLPIALGILKFYSHYNSVFRSELLDYLVAAGAILGGLFLLFRRISKRTLLVCGSFIAIEAFKAIIDRHDFYDVTLTIIAIIYLTIPFLRYSRHLTQAEHKKE